MAESIFTHEDIKVMEAEGLTEEKVLAQLELFKKGAPMARLDRPCTVGDGIAVIAEDEREELIAAYDEAVSKGRVLKFVPASGAASRMFKDWYRYYHESKDFDSTSEMMADFADHFTDNNGKPQIMTSHSVHLYKDINKFPAYSPRETYNSFYRYRTLHDFLQNHRGKISPDDAKRALGMVYGHTVDADEGAAFPIPCRTLWPMVYDVNERSFEVKFYLKDGPIDPKTGDPSLIFSRPFKFRLKTDKK